jgi:hypothetical protein
MNRDESRRMFSTIKERAPFTLQQLADMAGLSRDSFYSWSVERRTAPPEVFPRIAAALRRKAAELLTLADELDRTT